MTTDPSSQYLGGIEPQDNEVWQEADSCLLARFQGRWMAFGADTAREDLIRYPLRRLLDRHGRLVATGDHPHADQHYPNPKDPT